MQEEDKEHIRDMVDSLNIRLSQDQGDLDEDQKDSQEAKEFSLKERDQAWSQLKETLRYLSYVFSTSHTATSITPYRVELDELQDPEEVLITFRAKGRNVVARFKCDDQQPDVIRFVATLDNQHSNRDDFGIYELNPIEITKQVLVTLQRFMAKIEGRD